MSSFKFSWSIYPLKLKNVFTISRGSKSEVPNVFLKLEKGGIIGYGEAGPNKRYEETAENVSEYLDKLPKNFFDDLSDATEIPLKIDAFEKETRQENHSARMAIEMAWLDWWAKSQSQPLWKLWGFNSAIAPVTSFTIGIDTPEIMQKKILEASQYPVYKIKLGTSNDREIIQAIREVTDKPLRVDANEGWLTVEQAKREIEFLESQNVDLIEQPMPSSMIEEMKILKQWSPLPLCADESFIGDESLDEIAECFHVINIKLMKIGSLVKGREVLKEAKKLGLQVMIGCMIESSLANAAGTLLALDADFADLDGHLLISNDLFSGLKVDEFGNISLSEDAGFGVTIN